MDHTSILSDRFGFANGVTGGEAGTEVFVTEPFGSGPGSLPWYAGGSDPLKIDLSGLPVDIVLDAPIGIIGDKTISGGLWQKKVTVSKNIKAFRLQPGSNVIFDSFRLVGRWTDWKNSAELGDGITAEGVPTSGVFLNRMYLANWPDGCFDSVNSEGISLVDATIARSMVEYCAHPFNFTADRLTFAHNVTRFVRIRVPKNQVGRLNTFNNVHYLTEDTGDSFEQAQDGAQLWSIRNMYVSTVQKTIGKYGPNGGKILPQKHKFYGPVTYNVGPKDIDPTFIDACKGNWNGMMVSPTDSAGWDAARLSIEQEVGPLGYVFVR